MKQTKLSILVVLVVIVWGTIGYRIYDGLEEGHVERKIHAKKEPLDSIRDNRYKLLFTYKDPFLRKNVAPTVATPAVKSYTQVKAAVPKKVEVIVDWSFVKYNGAVYNSKKKRKVAMITFGRSEQLMCEGDVAEGFVMVEINPDSVKLMFGRSVKFIKRSTVNTNEK